MPDRVNFALIKFRWQVASQEETVPSPYLKHNVAMEIYSKYVFFLLEEANQYLNIFLWYLVNKYWMDNL